MAEENESFGAYDDMSLTECIKEMHEVRQKLDQADEITKGYQKMYDFLSIRVVPAKMDADGVNQIKVNGIGRVNLRGDLWTQTLSPFGLQEWLVQHKLGDLIQPGVNGSTLKAMLKERMRRNPKDFPSEDDRDLPGDEIVKVTPYTRAVITKA